MNKKIKGLVVISGNLFLLMCIVALWMNSIKTQRIHKSDMVQIRIVNEENRESILQKKDIFIWFNEFYKKDVRKIPVYALELKKLEEYIASQSLVEKADIYLDGKNALHADVYQRTPIVRVIDNSGDQYYLDENGYKIPVSEKYAARVIVATGPLAKIQGQKMIGKEKIYYSGLIQIIKAIDRDTFVKALIEQIDMDANGEFTLIPKVGREEIFLGSSELIDDKLSRLKLFYKENMGRQGWNVYQQINLKFKGQVIGKRIQQES